MGRIVYERRSRGIVQIEMKEEIRRFAEYLEAEKHASENTRVSYQRDLMQMAAFLEGMGIRELSVSPSFLLPLRKRIREICLDETENDQGV